MVGLIPLYACLVLEDEVIKKLPGFQKRLQWFLDNRPDLAKQVSPAFETGRPFSRLCSDTTVDIVPGHSA